MSRQRRIIARMKKELSKRKKTNKNNVQGEKRTRNKSPAKTALVCYNCGLGIVNIGEVCGFCGKINKNNKEVN